MCRNITADTPHHHPGNSHPASHDVVSLCLSGNSIQLEKKDKHLVNRVYRLPVLGLPCKPGTMMRAGAENTSFSGVLLKLSLFKGLEAGFLSSAL